MSTEPSEQQAENGRELISRREFARRMNWVPSYVVKLCEQGKITVWVTCPGCGSTCNSRTANCTCGEAIDGIVDTRRGKVDGRTATQELERAKHPEKSHVAARHAEARGDARPSAPADLELPLGDDKGDDNVASYAQSKAKREEFQAKLAELDYMKRIGLLGDLDAMTRESFKVARQVRDSLFSMPDRLAPILAAEREVASVHALLLEEITRVCNELYRTLGGEPDTTAVAG